MKKKQSKKTGKRFILLGIEIVILLLIIGGGGYWFYTHSTPKLVEEEQSAFVDSDAAQWDDKISNEESSIEGRILVPGYSGAKLQAGETTLKLRIGNPEENTCYLKAQLKLEDGTVLYESGLIEPGKGFEEIELNQALVVGEYQAMVHYQGYTMDDKQNLLNSSDSAFTLTVLQ